MQYQIKDGNGNWINGQPSGNGQHYRAIDDAGGIVESFWSIAASNSWITRLAFRNRFTFAEKVAIETAAETDATVRVLLKDQETATFIDLARPDTQQGVQLLVSKNLITTQRAAEILSLTIQPDEISRG